MLQAFQSPNHLRYTACYRGALRPCSPSCIHRPCSCWKPAHVQLIYLTLGGATRTPRPTRGPRFPASGLPCGAGCELPIPGPRRHGRTASPDEPRFWAAGRQRDGWIGRGGREDLELDMPGNFALPLPLPAEAAGTAGTARHVSPGVGARGPRKRLRRRVVCRALEYAGRGKAVGCLCRHPCAGLFGRWIRCARRPLCYRRSYVAPPCPCRDRRGRPFSFLNAGSYKAVLSFPLCALEFRGGHS